jgi:hypothetical protein
MQITTVANNLFIVYHFTNSKDAKEFELSFVRNINDDGSNLLESFIVTQREKDSKEEEEQFIVKLKLPKDAIEALKTHAGLLCVTMESEPSCPIYRDMMFNDKKSVRLVDKNFDKPVVNIMTVYNGSKMTRTVPQRWLEIEEISYRAVVNSGWALNPKNIVTMKDGAVVTMFNGREVLTSMEIIKQDGLTVSLHKKESGFVDPKSGLMFQPEHLIMK